MNRAFWEKLLHLWCWLVAGFGLMFAGGGLAVTDAGAGLFYWLVSGGALDAGSFEAAGMRSTVAIMGAVMFGWGCSLIVIFRAVGADVRVWRGLAWAIIAWYVVDSALSVATGIPLNAGTNTLFLALFLAPAFKLGFFSRETVSRSPA